MHAGSLIRGLFSSRRQNGSQLKESLATADSMFRERRYDQARQLYEQLASRSHDEHDFSTEVESLAQVARCFLTSNDIENARQILDRAAELASPKYPCGWSRYLGVKGRLEWKTNNLAAAKQTFKDQYQFCHKHKLVAGAIDAVNMMSIVGTPEEQISWSMIGINESETTGEHHWLGPLWNNLAVTYSEQGDYHRAYDAFLKAREYHLQYGTETNRLYADYQLGWVLRMRGDFELALSWLRPALAWAERIECFDVMAQASQDIGEILIDQKDTAKGLECLQRALAYFREAGYDKSDPDILSRLCQRISDINRQS